jgi:hypothetical protein
MLPSVKGSTHADSPGFHRNGNPICGPYSLQKGLDFCCKQSVSVACDNGRLAYPDLAPLAMPPLWGFGGDGATVVDRPGRWVVMQAPTGQRFCVVRVQRPGFPRTPTAGIRPRVEPAPVVDAGIVMAEEQIGEAVPGVLAGLFCSGEQIRQYGG